ncbi:hypothetical protein BJV74DRAFT_881653 [Russula compacta]|nr:hypothetical protein BJV74DRAFT_881653 [Russula compacta]
MLAPPQGPVQPPPPTDPLILYSQSLRNYTLRLWMESRKQAEERVRARAHKKHHGAGKAPSPTSSFKQPMDAERASSMSSDGSSSSSVYTPQTPDADRHMLYTHPITASRDLFEL